jgi:hypothetical protein
MSNTIELTYTLYGDANLDHQVNSADLQRLLAFFNTGGAWDQGDVNYDGIVNSTDLQAILFTFNTMLGNQTTPLAIAAAATVPSAGAPDMSSWRAIPVTGAAGSGAAPVHPSRPVKTAFRKRH